MPASQPSPAGAAAGQEVLPCVPPAGGTRPWKPQDLFKLDPAAHPPAEKGARADISRAEFLEEYILGAITKVAQINNDLQQASFRSGSDVKAIAIGHLYKLHALLQKDLLHIVRGIVNGMSHLHSQQVRYTSPLPLSHRVQGS